MFSNEYYPDDDPSYIEDEPDPTTCDHDWKIRFIELDTFYLCAKCQSIITKAEYDEIDDIPF